MRFVSYGLTSQKKEAQAWDNPKPNENSETEDEVDGMVQNAEIKRIEEATNQDIREDNRGEVPMQCMTNTHGDFLIAPLCI